MKYKNLLIPNTALNDELSNSLEKVTYQIFSVRHTLQSKIRTLSNVLVPYIKIAIIRNGYCNITIQGIHYKGGPGDIFIIPAYRIHSAQFISESLETYELLFQVSGQFYQEKWLLHFNHINYFNELMNNSEFEIIDEIFNHAKENMNGYVTEIKHLIDYLTIKMSNSLPNQNTSPTIDNAAMRTVESFLTALEHSDAFFTVKDYCNELSISQSYLCRSTRAIIGLSPQTLIIKHRMYLSLTLLADCTLSIKEISAQLGYLNPNYFSMQFKQTFNLTPRQYRAIYFNIN